MTRKRNKLFKCTFLDKMDERGSKKNVKVGGKNYLHPSMPHFCAFLGVIVTHS
jgi:hypothetical protein